jgi:hypothetical protein
MRTKDIIVTIKELEKKGLVRKVNVQSPPDDVKKTGDHKAVALSKSLNLYLNCADKSICFVNAMQEVGEIEWRFVPGFAFRSDCKYPFRHVWIRNGERHYDPTWYMNWSPEDIDYYQLVHHFEVKKYRSGNDIVNQGNHILRLLGEFAEKWNFTLAGQLD